MVVVVIHGQTIRGWTHANRTFSGTWASKGLSLFNADSNILRHVPMLSRHLT